jgi:hypothetical protein
LAHAKDKMGVCPFANGHNFQKPGFHKNNVLGC